MSESKLFSYRQYLQNQETAESIKYTLNTMIDMLESKGTGEGFLLDWSQVEIDTDHDEFVDDSSIVEYRRWQIDTLYIRVRGLKE